MVKLWVMVALAVCSSGCALVYVAEGPDKTSDAGIKAGDPCDMPEVGSVVSESHFCPCPHAEPGVQGDQYCRMDGTWSACEC